jgi:hypothetical protein
VPTAFSYPTEYFLSEGKENLESCLRASFEAAERHGIDKIVIFTGAGEGVKLALKKFRCKKEYSHISLIAVTFPANKKFNVKNTPHRITAEDRGFFKKHNVPVIHAHLPFDPITAQHRNHGILGQDLTLIGNALNIFCGSMSLCVQATVIACDAGYVEFGEHVIAVTSDTSILVRASSTEKLLTDFIIREIICKPVILTIGKKEEGIDEGQLENGEQPKVLEASHE